MIEVSKRCAVVATIILLAALVPVLAHELADLKSDPCAQAGALGQLQRIPDTRFTGERREELNENVIQRSEVRIPWAAARSGAFQGRVVRSFDPVYVYERPFRFLDDKFEVANHELRWVEVDGKPLPVHLVYSASDIHELAAYFYVYGNEPVERPLMAQLGAAFRNISTGSEPMTLFMISGTPPRDRRAEGEDFALRWLADAWRFYRASCSE